MADIKQLERALINADAAGDADAARALAGEIRKMRAGSNEAEQSSASDSSLVALGAGLGKGFGQVALNAQRYAGKGINAVGDFISPPERTITSLVTGKREDGNAVGNWLVDDAERGLKKIEGELAPYKENSPIAATTGEIGGNVIATLPVGGVLASGVRAVAPGASALASSIASGGFRTGLPAATTMAGKAGNMLTRVVGGGITGGVSGGLIDPEHARTGALIGGALPPALAATGKVLGYAGRAAGSLVKPFTASGQQEIAGNVIRKFAEGGPTAINARQIVSGSAPTLAEATGNAGLATLQRGARDLRPNAFAEREAQNAAARLAAFDGVAGDAGKLDFFRASRSEAAGDLYGQALQQSGSQPATPYIKGQITQLLKRPSINDARRAAQKLAMERGEKPAPTGSLQALHDMKTALDDKIGEAVRAGKGGEAKALGATKDKLLDVMEKLSPEYAQARVTYAEMSKPINAMEALQGLRITDAQRNITLAKVQNAIRSIENARSGPGTSAAKSIAEDQFNTLVAIRDDLLRQSNLGAGRSIGSNTFQNLSTDNILNSMAGNTLSRLADRVGVAGALGQVGRLAYSGPNEAIRNRLVDMMLTPQLAQPALTGATQIGGPNALARLMSSPAVQQPIYRSAPALSSSR